MMSIAAFLEQFLGVKLGLSYYINQIIQFQMALYEKNPHQFGIKIQSLYA